jgi:hypothetical protein
MRKLIICLWSIVALFANSLAQTGNEPSITTKIQYDSVGLAEPFSLTISVENSRTVSFEKIAFRDFDILQGPFQSSQFSMVNGKSSSSTTFTYLLKARETGYFVLESQTIYIDNNSYKTPETAVVVVEEIQKTPQDNFANPFDMPSMGFNDDIFGRMQQQQEEMMKRHRELFNNPDGFFNNPNDIFNFPRQFGPDNKEFFKKFDDFFQFKMPPVQPKLKPAERTYRL